MNKVLIITYHFPPDAAVGTIRPAKFAKYLPDFGWEPFILTVKEKYYGQLDRSKLQELGGRVIISRTTKLPNLRDIYINIKFQLAKIKGIEKQLSESILKDRSIEEKDIVEKGIKATILRFIFSIFMWLPDDKIGWVAPAVLKGLQIIRKESIHTIFTTSPPHSVHLIGLILKKITGVRWIADFRDPWVVDFRKALIARTKLSDNIEAWLEKKVVGKADIVISNNERLTEKFKDCYPNQEKNKFLTISNGYDLEDFEQLRNIQKYQRFTLTYAGTFYLHRTPKLLLRAASELLRDKKIDPNNFMIQFIGDIKYAKSESVEKITEELNLSHHVQIREWMPYKEALEEMAKSHVLLLLATKQPYQIPAKAFDYIGMDANIVAVVDNGATSDLLMNYKKATLVKENDIDSLKEAIVYFYRRYSDAIDEGSRGFINGYERSYLTKKLVEELDNFHATE